MAAYRGLKEALAHYAKCLTPGHLHARSSERVQSGRNEPMDFVDIGALLREADIEPGSDDEANLLGWAQDLCPRPDAAYKRFSRALNRAREAGREDLIGRPRQQLADVIRTHLPGGQGLRELPLDPRSPLNDDDCETEVIG